MGVEYRHFLVPRNPSFVPAKEVIKKIDNVLNKWNLKAGAPKLYDLTLGTNSIVLDSLENLVFGQGLAIKYHGIDGIAASRIMGKSISSVMGKAGIELLLVQAGMAKKKQLNPWTFREGLNSAIKGRTIRT